MIVGYYKNCLYTTDISSALKKKKKKKKESQYMVSHLETGRIHQSGRTGIGGVTPIENKVFVARNGVFLEREFIFKGTSGSKVQPEEVQEPQDNIELLVDTHS